MQTDGPGSSARLANLPQPGRVPTARRCRVRARAPSGHTQQTSCLCSNHFSPIRPTAGSPRRRFAKAHAQWLNTHHRQSSCRKAKVSLLGLTQVGRFGSEVTLHAGEHRFRDCQEQQERPAPASRMRLLRATARRPATMLARNSERAGRIRQLLSVGDHQKAVAHGHPFRPR